MPQKQMRQVVGYLSCISIFTLVPYQFKSSLPFSKTDELFIDIPVISFVYIIFYMEMFWRHGRKHMDMQMN